MNKLKTIFKNNWKIILISLSPLLIISIIFALPIKTVPVPVTETYWETEMLSEPYVTTETYTDTEAYTTTELKTETVFNQSVGYGNWSKSIQIDKPGSTVTIEFSNYGETYYQPRYIIIGDNYSPYWNNPWYGNNYFYPGYYGGWGSPSYATIKVTSPAEVTKYRTVTKTRDVTKYREVPTQVKKERTVIQYVKMSMWESMFR